MSSFRTATNTDDDDEAKELAGIPETDRRRPIITAAAVSGQNFFPAAKKLFIDMLRNDLGKDQLDDPMHSSCTGIGYHSDIVPLETIMTVVARQFALMTEAGYENFVTSCITSFGVYSEILATWHEFPETEEKARENLFSATGREFRKPASLAHTSDVVFHFREQIAARAKKRLVNAATGRTAEGRRAHRLPLRQDIPEVGHRRFGIPLCAGRHGRVVGRRMRGLSRTPPLLRDSGSPTTWRRPTAVIRSPIRTRNSRAWRPTSPISSWPTVRGARCSSTSGSTPSPKWRVRPTARTAMESRC